MPTRRSLIQNCTMIFAGLSTRTPLAAEIEAAPLISIGLLTDVHHADKATAHSRFYRESLGKLASAIDHFKETRPDFVVELGDFIDQAPDVETELAWLAEAEQSFATLPMDRHYVLGNHCVGTLNKREFSDNTSAHPDGHYSWEQAGARFLVLDSCFREDGTPYARANFHWQDANLPEAQLDWLEAELQAADGPVIVFAHQRLDADKAHSVRNAAAARALFEASKKVVAVFQGHSHKNDLQQINGIPYATLVAMVEGSGKASSGFALLGLMPDGSLRVDGHLRQESFRLSPAPDSAKEL
jgi:3',5'-cyclic AMP phosphodiesterase CpdA